jgi:LCP family protein required for cell wall assembly
VVDQFSANPADPADPGPPGGGHPRLTVPPAGRTGLRAAAAALSFLLLIGSGLAWASFQNFTTSVPHGAPVPPLARGQHDTDGADQNVLLVGNDSRAGASRAELAALRTQDDGGSVNTDTMMVLHVPADGGKPTVVSFPRDSWVDIPGNGKGKINAAYGDGYTAAKNAHRSETAAQSAGILMTIKTISALTGLHIDHYMQVNLLGFYRISNAIGGVSVCLTKAQNPNTDADQFGKGYSGINLPKGRSVIKGSQALAFVRQRHGLPGGDLDRIKRQQYFLASAFHKITSAGVMLNPFKLHDLLNAVGSSLLTDPSLDLLSLARQFEVMAAGNISFQTIPNNGPQVIYPDGVATAIVQIDTAAMPGFIRQLQGQAADPRLAGARAARPSTVIADVLNATATVGLAGQNADRLKALGFKVDVVDSADDESATTMVQYPPGGQAGGKALAAVVPGATLVETTLVQRPTVVLGADGRQVKGLGSDAQRPAGPRATAPPAASKLAAPPADPLGCIN